jgi:2-polyprenyl-3-methyl-5-hydroxy-6-metoxy-1,4-benzoquinol methylase
LARERFDVYAFDGSKSAIDKLKKRMSAEKLSVNLDVFDAVETTYPEEYFDAVIDNVAIYANTINNIKIMYSNIFNMLKHGGKLLTTMFTADTTGADSGVKIEDNTFRDLTKGNLAGRAIVHFYTKDEIVDILKNTGFSNIVIDTMRYSDMGNIVSMLIVQADK